MSYHEAGSRFRREAAISELILVFENEPEHTRLASLTPVSPNLIESMGVFRGVANIMHLDGILCNLQEESSRCLFLAEWIVEFQQPVQASDPTIFGFHS